MKTPRRVGDVRRLISRVAARSYWASRGWAWASQIEVRPRLRVPVPRILATLDP